MAQLRQERVISRLHHIPFDYLVRPYNLFVPRILSLFATVISLCIVLYYLNRVAVMIQTGPTIYVCCSNCIPYRHAYLSIYLIGHKQAISFITFQYLSHIHEWLLLLYMHMKYSLSIILIFIKSTFTYLLSS